MKSFTQILRIAEAALGAMVVCAPMLVEARPRTPLRVFCIAAFEYLARLSGGTLGMGRRVAIAHACDFGSLRDEFYDERKLDVTEYRSLRNALRRIAPEEVTIRYIQELRQAERGRPMIAANAPAVAKAIIGYRQAVIELSLRWLEGISGLAVEAVRFQSLVSLVCLMQLADDLLDWTEDLAAGCPSYVTAFLLERPRMGIGTELRRQADALLQRTLAAAGWDAGAVPFAAAAFVTWAFVIALVKLRFPK